MSGGSTSISVSGGSDGIEAHYDDLVTLARLFGAAATDIGGGAFSLHGYLLDPGLYSAGLLDPSGAADFGERLVAALDGPHGLTLIAARCGAEDAGLRTAAAAYQAADRLEAQASTAVGALMHAPAAVATSLGSLASSHNPITALEALVTSDPQVAGVLMQGLLPLSRRAELLYPDGHAAVRAGGADPGADAAGPPRNLADIVRELGRRDDTENGEVDVRRMTGADGRTYVIVDIPGTKSASLAPVNHDVTSVATNLRAVEGQRTTYEEGVLQAMRAAGVHPGDPVLLVGHSLGGMVAVKTAIDCAHSGEFHVTNVLTAGSPIGVSAGKVPPGVQVLALENSSDVVPQLDGTPNPDRVNVTTVTFDHDDGSIGGNHSIPGSYLVGARAVDASTNPSVRAFLTGANGFLTASSVSTRTFVITRKY